MKTLTTNTLLTIAFMTVSIHLAEATQPTSCVPISGFVVGGGTEIIGSGGFYPTSCLSFGSGSCSTSKTDPTYLNCPNNTTKWQSGTYSTPINNGITTSNSFLCVNK